MSNIRQDKKQSFMMNVSIILFAQIAVKLLGMIYRLVITNVKGFGDSGNGYYSAGFQIYTMLLAISSVGIPNAVSKMVSAKTAVGDYGGAHRIFKTALVLFAGIGAFCSAALYFCAGFIAERVIEMAGAVYTLKALSPSIFFVCVSSVISGYFLGQNNMKATSSSQVLEQLFKCTLTVLIVCMMAGQAPEFMAAGANLATTLATMLSFSYLLFFYNKKKKEIWENVAAGAVKSEKKTARRLIKEILMIAIPISLGAIITSIARIIDTATITRGIKVAFMAGIPGKEGIPTLAQLTDEAVRLAGQLSKSDTLTNLPLALNIAFSTALVPSVSSAMALGKKEEAKGKISYSMLISILLVLPCAVGYITLAKPIYGLLYPNASLGWQLLMLTSVALIFMALNQTISGSLQGIGRVFVPAIGLLCGTIVKVILNLLLIRIPEINIYGAAISTICCHFIAFAVSFTVIIKAMDLKLSVSKYFIKPIFAAALMGGEALLVYRLLMKITSSNMISLMTAILTAVIFYGILIFALRILSKEEVEQLPFGKKLADKLY